MFKKISYKNCTHATWTMDTHLFSIPHLNTRQVMYYNFYYTILNFRNIRDDSARTYGNAVNIFSSFKNGHKPITIYNENKKIVQVYNALKNVCISSMHILHTHGPVSPSPPCNQPVHVFILVHILNYIKCILFYRAKVILNINWTTYKTRQAVKMYLFASSTHNTIKHEHSLIFSGLPVTQ